MGSLSSFSYSKNINYSILFILPCSNLRCVRVQFSLSFTLFPLLYTSIQLRCVSLSTPVSFTLRARLFFPRPKSQKLTGVENRHFGPNTAVIKWSQHVCLCAQAEKSTDGRCKTDVTQFVFSLNSTLSPFSLCAEMGGCHNYARGTKVRENEFHSIQDQNSEISSYHHLQSLLCVYTLVLSLLSR